MIKDGSQVTIEYTLIVDEQVVDTSKGAEPLTYQQGEQQIIPGLERGLEGHQAGETVEVTVKPEDAYGAEDPQGYQTVPRTVFKDPEQIAVGDRVEGRMEGQPFRASVAEIADETVTLNLNHPLAGKTLRFAVEIVAVE